MGLLEEAKATLSNYSPLRAWIVRRFDPEGEGMQEISVVAHLVQYTKDVLSFYTFVDGRACCIHMFNGWVDAEEVPLPAQSGRTN